MRRRREEQLEPPIVLKNIYFQKLISSPPWNILDSCQTSYFLNGSAGCGKMWLVIRGWGPIIQVRGMIQIVLYCTRFMALPDVAKYGRCFQVSKYGYDITISCKRTLHSMIRNPTFINTLCASWTFDEAYQLFPLSFYTRSLFLLSFLASLQVPSR